MKGTHIYFALAIGILTSCGGENESIHGKRNEEPLVTNKGQEIVFPNQASCSFFQTETVGNTNLNTEIAAPANISATVLRSEEGTEPIILFENPDLAGNYTLLLQHLINIRQIQQVAIPQRKLEFQRMEDLQKHGAATGRELSEAQTALAMEKANLANEKAAIIEHETKLTAAGFPPEVLKKASPGVVFIVCDIPENQVSKINEGASCKVTFTAFPNEVFTGKIEEVADLIDITTRMVKLRITVKNTDNKLKAGMFANVSFGISEGKVVNVLQRSVVTVQGENYVFVRKGNKFIRRKVILGNEVGDRVVIVSGLKQGETIAEKGVMQLKGLSFGY